MAFIVGYMGNDMNAKGATMASGSFAAVGAADGSLTLADLSVTGYDAPVYNSVDEELVSGGVIGGRFLLRFLNTSGVAESHYYWIDDGEHPAGWYASVGGDAINGGADSVSIPAGRAAWIAGSGLKLQSAGAVNENDIAFVTSPSGASAVGNATPCELTLAKLIVTGYDAPDYDKSEEQLISGGVIGGKFLLRFLNSSGVAEARYYWIDDGEHVAGWYSSVGGDAIEGGAASVKIPAGKGMWIAGNGLTLRIPAPEL